jgi:nitroimidazol reductase NimA-like FMN-containing flavoprotein (pyridoxamine 5'-phosphate oxidase superfamily)
MRRQDRQITDDGEIWRVVERGSVCHVAFCAENWPYVVPLSYGILGRTLYFHCAMEGTKLDLLKENPNVCFEIETDVETVTGGRLSETTVRYRSVIGFGHGAIVTETQERQRGLRALTDRYVESKDTAPLSPAELADVSVFRIDVHSLSGKSTHDSADSNSNL